MMTSAFYIPSQQLYIKAPQFGTHPNIQANGPINPHRPMFGTTVSGNPNFSGNSTDTFTRRTK